MTCTLGVSVCTGGATCINSVCACAPNTFIAEQRCQLVQTNSEFTVSVFPRVKSARAGQPGTACTDAMRCTGNSFCYNSYCTCQQGQVIYERECVPFVATGVCAA
jgi:hypothetical protein